MFSLSFDAKYDSFLNEINWKVQKLISHACYYFSNEEQSCSLTIWINCKINCRSVSSFTSRFSNVDEMNSCMFGQISEDFDYNNEKYNEEFVQKVLSSDFLGKVIWYIYNDDKLKPFFSTNFLSKGLNTNIETAYNNYLACKQHLKNTLYELYVNDDVANIIVNYV